MPTPTLHGMLRRVVDEQFGGQFRGFARAVQLDAAHAGRLVKGLSPTMSVETCLRVADVCDLDPTDVLRAAGKAEFADMVVRLFGRAAKVRASRTGEQREWDQLLDDMDPAARRHLRELARLLTR